MTSGLTVTLVVVLVVMIVIMLRSGWEKEHRRRCTLTREKTNIFTLSNNLRIAFYTLETRGSTNLTIRDMVNLHNTNLRFYVSLHPGYTYTFLDSYPSKLSPVWQKLQLVREKLVDGGPDVVAWLDSDTCVRHPLFRFDDVIANSPASMLFGYDRRKFNAGVLFFKNDETSRKFIDDCFEIYFSRTFCFLKADGLNSEWAGDCYEEGIINTLSQTSEYQGLVHIMHEVSNAAIANHRSVINHVYSTKWLALPKLRELHSQMIEDYHEIYNKKPTIV